MFIIKQEYPDYSQLKVFRQSAKTQLAIYIYIYKHLRHPETNIPLQKMHKRASRLDYFPFRKAYFRVAYLAIRLEGKTRISPIVALLSGQPRLFPPPARRLKTPVRLQKARRFPLQSPARMDTSHLDVPLEVRINGL